MRRTFATLIAAAALFASAMISTGVASAATESFPTIGGSYGSLPTIAFPGTAAPTGLESKILSLGKGAVIKKGQLLIANYVGQIWNGKVFDSSFARSETAAFPIGVGAVIPGWDTALVGKTIGSRVVLVVPPADGYGTSGNTQAGIKGTDTLVFVIDLVASYTSSTGSKEKASSLNAATGGITIKNLQSKAPKISVKKGTTKPTTAKAILLARGTGAKVTKGMVILQFAAIDWTGKSITNTWTSGTPDGEYLGVTSDGNPFSALVGDRIGGWSLLELPANTNGGPYVLAIHIVGEVPAKASK